MYNNNEYMSMPDMLLNAQQNNMSHPQVYQTTTRIDVFANCVGPAEGREGLGSCLGSRVVDRTQFYRISVRRCRLMAQDVLRELRDV